MTGYVRVDTSNNIADGNVISADDLDNEFDGVQAAFNATTGHTHGGGVGEGAPITKLGPTNDVTVSASLLAPKTTNTVDIGSSSLKYKDLYLAGNASIGGTLAVTGATTLSAALTYGGVTLSNAVTGTGNMVLSNSPTLVTPALGTPSALVGTNITGTAAGLSIGGNAATATTSTNVSGGTASVTTLSASGAVTLSGGTANGVAYLNGSKVLTTGSALTFDGSTVTNTGVGYSVNNANALLRFGNAAATRTGYLQVRSDAFEVWSDQAAVPMVFGVSNTEQMRLTSTGLGIGTSSPAAKLDVNGGTNSEMRVTTSGSGYLQVGQFTNGAFIGTSSTDATAGVLRFGTGGTTRATLDSSGNLGLGVTPSAWSSWKAMQIGSRASFVGNTTASFVANNFYYDGADGRYIATANATLYEQSAGVHKFFTAPSGTAGNAISFTQAMSLTAAGELLVGTTSNSSFAGKAVFVVNGSSDNGVCVQVTNASGGSTLTFFNSSAASVGSITTTASATAYNTSSDYRLKNITGPITTSGAYIDSLNPVEGTWKADGSTFVGLIAHEVQEASRTQVATGVKDGEEMQGMDYSSAEIIANLIAEVKSLRQRLAAAGI